MNKPLILLGVLCICALSCTREPQHPNIPRLQKSQVGLEAEITALDEKLKTAGPENATSLQNEKELVKSRLERVKEQLKALDPASVSTGPTTPSAH